VDWIQLALGGEQWRVFLNTVLNLPVGLKRVEFLEQMSGYQLFKKDTEVFMAVKPTVMAGRPEFDSW
jgi:hypothetical protein